MTDRRLGPGDLLFATREGTPSRETPSAPGSGAQLLPRRGRLRRPRSRPAPRPRVLAARRRVRPQVRDGPHGSCSNHHHPEVPPHPPRRRQQEPHRTRPDPQPCPRVAPGACWLRKRIDRCPGATRQGRRVAKGGSEPAHSHRLPGDPAASAIGDAPRCNSSRTRSFFKRTQGREWTPAAKRDATSNTSRRAVPVKLRQGLTPGTVG